MSNFRTHYTDGPTVDVEAKTPDHARKIAKAPREGTVRKVKVVKEKEDA